MSLPAVRRVFRKRINYKGKKNKKEREIVYTFLQHIIGLSLDRTRFKALSFSLYLSLPPSLSFSIEKWIFPAKLSEIPIANVKSRSKLRITSFHGRIASLSTHSISRLQKNQEWFENKNAVLPISFIVKSLEGVLGYEGNTPEHVSKESKKENRRKGNSREALLQ